MKTRFVAACAIAWLSAAVLSAQSGKDVPVHINLDEAPAAAKKSPSVNPHAPAKPEAKPAAPAPGAATAKAAPAAPAAKPDTKKDPKTKDDAPGKIEGMEIARGSGFLGLQIVNGTFKLSFYDAKKKPVAPDVARAAFRWNVSYQKLPERYVLTPSGTALVSDRTVKPPYQFKLFITLFKGEGEEDAENLTVDFTQGG